MRVFLSVMLLGCSLTVSAQTARQQLQIFSKDLSTAQVTFQQIVTGPNGEKIQSAQGVLQMLAPDKFRWEYAKPSPQLIVADGKKIWIYDPDLQQVTVKAQDALNQDNPLSAITKPELLSRFYTVSELSSKQGIRWLQLVPKNKQSSPFDKAWLGFNANGFVSMRLFDALGQVSDFSFGIWKKNNSIPAKRFQFIVPKGVDVVE
jgi:outer membrane lipoprotein carrier protein